jgi:signal transduction histidine kinase
MRTRHDLPIGWRLGVGFAAIFVVMAVLGLLVLFAHGRSERAQREYATRHVPLADAAGALERTLLQASVGLRTYLFSRVPAARDEALERVAQARRALDQLESLASAGELRDELPPMRAPVEGYLGLAASFLQGTDGEDAVATERQLTEARERALGAVRQFDAIEAAHRDSALQAMEQSREDVSRALMVALALVAGILLFVGFQAMRSITRPTRDLVRIATALQEGEWKPALEWSPEAVAARGDKPHPRSELARIARAFGAAAATLDRREARLRADARVASVAASTLRKETFTEAALTAMADGSRAHAGTMFVRDATGLVRAAGRGFSTEAGQEAARRELARRAVDARHVVEDGDRMALALTLRDDTLGAAVLERAGGFDAEARQFLEAAASQVAIGLANVLAHEQLQALSGQIQVQNEEIQAQLEEIQAQSEQLQAQNEELHAQAARISEANALLVRQAEELTRADERKNEFLALLAHEVRNPLSAIANSVFMLRHPALQPQQAEQARAVIERQMRSLTRMVDDLLDVTRISRGKLRLQRESLDLGQLVREGVEDQRHAIEGAGLALSVQVPAERLAVLGDRTRLGQVLSNLLSNAVKFSDHGGRVDVSLERAADGRHALLHVRDTGIGIDQALLASLFEPFRQGESAQERGNAGLGLGLALARALVQMHGGQIVAHSAGAQAGAEFVVTLPLQGSTAASGDARDFLEGGAHAGDGIVSEDFGPPRD